MSEPLNPLDGLNDQQRAAAAAVRGPVCILAGAGSGKTTTLTRRIAHQIASGEFVPRDVLAITFTDRAANELRRRLSKLGIQGDVRARTFHAEALHQVAHFTEAPSLLPSKAAVVSPIVRNLPPPFKFRATKDIAGEIERAKNRRVPPERYIEDVESSDHAPPIPSDLMARVYKEYERRKAKAGKIDFEDLLEEAIRLLENRPDAADQVRARYKAFSVDEYQDVNVLQHTLLERWLHDRNDVCVVGDDYQSIYGFTGATPDWLLDFPKRHPGAQVFTLTHNYRSSPQVLDVANRLTGGLGGREKILTATRDAGPDCSMKEYGDDEDETEAIVARIHALAAADVPYEDMAILYRINARSDDYEEALARARIPYQVRDGAFLRRPGPRALLRLLQRATPGYAARDVVEAAARELGWDPDVEPDTASGAEEVTRLADLGRLVTLAAGHDGDAASFLADLRKRFEDASEARGVVLSTYHRAKGLEWEAVFLPRLEERELPFALAKHDENVAEERRLLYVGITRARTHLHLSWTRYRGGKSVRPSRFVSELVGSYRPAERAPRKPKSSAAADVSDPALFERLRVWRKETAQEAEVPPYVVFHDATLREVCDRRPQSLGELSAVPGIGPTKLAKYGTSLLEIVKSG